MSNASLPPRFVPTLTEVVVLSDQTIDNSSNSSNSSISSDLPVDDLDESSTASEASNAGFGNFTNLQERKDQEEQIVRRVLQRVDVILEQRLSEAIGRIVSEQTQTLGLRLKEEIEYVVRDSVSLAFEEASQTYR